MITFVYYTFWALLALIYGLLIFTVYKFYKKKQSIKKYIVPAFLNCLLSFIGNFVLLFSAISTLYDMTHWHIYIGPLLGSIAFMIIPNILLYRLYYKKKNKLTRKEYFISSLYGLLFFILYLIQINVMPR